MAAIATPREMLAQAGQQTGSTILLDLRQAIAGECNILVGGTTDGTSVLVSIDDQHVPLPHQIVGDSLQFVLREPLKAGETITVTHVPSGGRDSTRVLADANRATPPMSCEQELVVDPRPLFEANFRVGYLSETFAPEREKLRSTFVDGEERDDDIRETDKSTVRQSVLTALDASLHPWGEKQPLWLIGRFIYSARQSAICLDTSDNPCPENGVPDPSDTLLIVRRADAAEIYAGFRWEFANIARNTGKLYAGCSFGAVFIEGVGDSALSNHTCMIGGTLYKGRFTNSYLEVGLGKSEVFSPGDSNWDRRKFSVYLTSTFVERPLASIIKRALNSFQPYFHVLLDRGDGPDSFRTSFGLVFDFIRPFGAP